MKHATPRELSAGNAGLPNLIFNSNDNAKMRSFDHRMDTLKRLREQRCGIIHVDKVGIKIAFPGQIVPL